MKRKLTMMLAFILAASSFVGCEQDTTELVKEEAIAQSYPGSPVEADETEQISELLEGIQGKTPEEIAQMIEDGTFVPTAEPQISAEEEPETPIDPIGFTPIPTTVDPPIDIPTQGSVIIPTTVDPPIDIPTQGSVIIPTTVDPPIDIPTQGSVIVPTTVDPPIDIPTQGSVIVPTTVDPPIDVTAPEYPTANVDYNLTLTAGENTVIENVSVSVQMKQPLEEGVVPASNGWYMPGEIVSNLVSANTTKTFSVEDWRTTLRNGYETIITIDYGKPFSISTDLVERIPSVNGVVEVYISQLYIDDNNGSADINITLTDETDIW